MSPPRASNAASFDVEKLVNGMKAIAESREFPVPNDHSTKTREKSGTPALARRTGLSYSGIESDTHS
jgi:hypothetical protein